MASTFAKTHHSLLSRLCLAVAFLPMGAIAGCDGDDKASQAQEAISKTNLSCHVQQG